MKLFNKQKTKRQNFIRGIVLFFFAILFYSYFPTVGIVFAGIVSGIFLGRWLDWDKTHVAQTQEMYAQDIAEGDEKFKKNLEERFPSTVDVYDTPTRLQEQVLANNPPKTSMKERLKNVKKITVPDETEKEAEEWMESK